MTDPHPDAPVVFRPLAERCRNNGRRRIMGRQRMTDHGDHVEWTDGKTTQAFRLPDQADNGTDEYPVMTTVVLGEVRNPLAPGGVASYYIVFTDAAGEVLGRLRGVATLDVNYLVVREALPAEAWDPLVRRGVTLQREVVTGLRPFSRKHPDPTSRRFSLFRRA